MSQIVPKAAWTNFPTQRKSQASVLLPYLWDDQMLQKDALKELQEHLLNLHECLSHSYQLKLVYLEDGNFLKPEHLEVCKEEVICLKKSDWGSVLVDYYCDLLIAHGFEVLEHVHSDRIPTMVYCGFIKEPKASALKYQKLVHTTPSHGDFFLCSSADSYKRLKNQSKLLGLENATIIKVETIQDLVETKNKKLESFLKKPATVSRQSALLALLEEQYQNTIKSQREELVEQRESQLAWLRKSFTGEIEKLVEENDKLRQGSQSKVSDKKVQELQEKLQLAQSRVQELELSDPQELSNPDAPVDQRKIHELQTYIKDLEAKVNRHENQSFFIFLHFFRQVFTTWFIRFPAALGLLVYHIGSGIVHRYVASR